MLISLVLIMPLASAECTDSDGGINYTVRGTYPDPTPGNVAGHDYCWCENANKTMSASEASGGEGEYTSKFICPYDNQQVYLMEGYCNEQGELRHEKYICPNGCMNGACVGGFSQSCTDSDSKEIIAESDMSIYHDYYYIKGECQDDYGGLRPDICNPEDPDYLIEQSCWKQEDSFSCASFGTGKGSGYKCPNGCKNGACIEKPAEEECVYGLKYDIKDYKYSKFSKEDSYPGFDIIKNPTKSTNVYKTWYEINGIYFYAIIASFDNSIDRNAEFEKVKGTLDGSFITYSPAGLLEYWSPSSYTPLKDQIVYWGEENDGMLMAWTNDIKSSYYTKCGNLIVIVGSEHSFELLSNKDMPEEDMSEFLLDVYKPLIDTYLKQYPAVFEKVVEKELEPTDETGPLEIPGNITEEEKALVCGGCILENNCYPFGYRKSGQYCSGNKEFVEQLKESSVCENSFECESNVCAGGECIGMNFIQQIIAWFKNLFGM